MITTKEIREKLIHIRRAKKWSQKDLAANCEVSAGTISRMESGLTPITINNLIKVADGLGYEVNIEFIKKGE